LIDIPYTIKDLIETGGNIQKWMNYRLSGHYRLLIYQKYFPYVIFPCIISDKGVKFRVTLQLFTVNEVMKDYSFSDIRMGDRVIDIGANCGGFCLHAAQMTDRVLALEPIVIDKLRDNILLNDANVMAIEGAIGTAEPKWFGTTRQTRKYSLSELKEILGGCDFLKCDCEGGEWGIQPEELSGIRRIEMELHKMGLDHEKGYADLMRYLRKHYQVVFDRCDHDKNLYGVVHASMKR